MTDRPPVEVSTTVKLKPWIAPNFAALALNHQQDAPNVAASIPVTELSEEALECMAQTWLDDLYQKADKKNPFQLSVRP